MGTPEVRSDLRSVKSTFLYQEVARELERYIAANELPVGAELPPERELAERLQTSRPSVREALRMLELVGLIRTRRSEPAVVGEVNLHLLTEWMGRSIPRSPQTMRELLDVREPLEITAAQLAARHVAPEHVAAFQANLALTAERASRGEPVLAQDTEFHSIVFRASGNAVLQRLTEVIGGLLYDLRTQVLVGSGRGEEMVRFHTAIADAIVAGDPARAADAMRAHMTSVKSVATHILDSGPEGPIDPAAGVAGGSDGSVSRPAPVLD